VVKLKDITWENFWRVVGLRPTEAQRGYLPENAVFMAQAYVNLKSNYDDICFAVYNGDEVVGFTKIVFVGKGEPPFNFDEDTYYLDALMIDESFQGRGFGKAALKEILDFIATKPWGPANSVKTACYDENTAAAAMYVNQGFKPTNQFVPNKKGLRLYILQ
jgi:diamine N-acetyltransferase